MFFTELSAVHELLDEEMSPEGAARIKAMIRPAIGFRQDYDTPVGDASSWIHGYPRLPADTAWPSVNGVALDFRASIDLGSLPRIDDWPNQPTSGRLAFFAVDYDEAVGPMGSAGAVLRINGDEIVERTEHRPYDSPSALGLIGVGWSAPLRGFDEGPDEIPADLLDECPDLTEFDRDTCAFSLLGIASPLQGNPLALHDPSDEPRLLAQLDTRDVFIAYWTIASADLAAGDFDATGFYACCD